MGETGSLEARARALFEDYGRLSNEALRDPQRADTGRLADAFAAYFVGANPLGVMGGAKGESFPTTIKRGFEVYRAAGGTRLEIVHLEVETLDPFNAMVRADWEFDYVRPRDGATGTIAFRNVYFVNFADGQPRIFAWITPDEQKAMREHGLA